METSVRPSLSSPALVAHVRRPRLTAQLAAQRVAVLVAGSGYGKSSLAVELAGHLERTAVFVDIAPDSAEPAAVVAVLRRAFESGGLAGVADALEPEEAAATDDAGEAFVAGLRALLSDREDPLLIVIDEVQRASGAAAKLLARLSGDLPAPHHLLLCGRRLPGVLQQAAVDLPRCVDHNLAFTPGESLALAGQLAVQIDEAAAAALVEATGGWPAAVVVALRANVTDPRTLREGIDGLVERLLAPADEPTRLAAARVGHLPLLAPDVIGAVAAGVTLEQLADAGLPMRRRPDGWIVISDALREALAARAPLGVDAGLAAAAVYLEHGQAPVAVQFLLARREFAGLAALLASRRWQELQALTTAELRSLLGMLPEPVLEAEPGLLLSVARVAGTSGEFAWRRTLLARAAAMPAVAAEPPLARLIQAEQASDAAIDGSAEIAIALADDVLSAAPGDELLARGRALVARGRARAFMREPGSLSGAADDLGQAVVLLRLAGERELVASTLQLLGYSVHFAEGDLDAARQRLGEAIEAAPLAPRARANAQTFLADALLYAGELDMAEAVLREVEAVARRLRDQLLLGYHAWIQAGIASRRGNAAAVLTWLAEAERHPGDWFAHPTGIEFLADAADHLGRIGEHAEATRYLARVERRCAEDGHAGIDQIALLAQAIHGARAGDAEAAERDLVAALETEQLPRREAWRIQLLRGLAAHRRGDEAAAARHAARAFEEVAAMGHPELPALHEPHAAAELGRLAERRGSRAASAALALPARLAVRLLGGFAVTADGRAADPPAGRPATLVKLLALARGPVAVDEAIEVLWPDVAPETGRARMRNVLSRIRSSCGDLVTRQEDALLLARGVVVDAAEFERAAVAALPGRGAADPDIALARHALALHAGELLPGDRYEDYSVASRERVALRRLALLDRLASDAAARGDIDEALRLLDDAIETAPLEEHRYEQAAELALGNGRRQRARTFVEAATAVLTDLGVSPSGRLRELTSRATSSDVATLPSRR